METARLGRFVLATDGSEAAGEAVSRGLRLAAAAGARVTVVTVHAAPPDVLGDADYPRKLAAEAEDALRRVESALQEAAALGVEAEGEVFESEEPATEILRVADALRAELIVVGSRGLGAVKGAVLGSVSSEVLRRSERPVLVVRHTPPTHA